LVSANIRSYSVKYFATVSTLLVYFIKKLWLDFYLTCILHTKNHRIFKCLHCPSFVYAIACIGSCDAGKFLHYFLPNICSFWLSHCLFDAVHANSCPTFCQIFVQSCSKLSIPPHLESDFCHCNVKV